MPTKLITRYGQLKAMSSDNGGERNIEPLRASMIEQGIRIAIIDPGKPWQYGSNESFNGALRNECLNAELFDSLIEIRGIIERLRPKGNDLLS